MANIYDIELLNSIMNPKTPRLGLEPLYPNFGAPMPMEESDIAPEYGLNLIGNDLPYLKELTPMTDMGATGITPQLAQSIMQQAQLPTQFGTSVDNFQGFTDKEDFLGKTEQYETDKFGYRKQSGIAKLFEFLGDFPTPFNLARRGLESLRGLNNRIQNSDFGQSDNFAEFLKRR